MAAQPLTFQLLVAFPLIILESLFISKIPTSLTVIVGCVIFAFENLVECTCCMLRLVTLNRKYLEGT